LKTHKGLLLAALLAFAPGGQASAEDVYTIGSSLGLTGYGSLTDGHWLDGLKLAVDAVNAKGGVLGKKVKLVYEDNKSTPQQAVVGYRKMMSEDNANAFGSGCISAGNFAAASFVTKAKLPMFLCSILPRQPDEQKWAFSFLPPPKFEVVTRYEYLKNKTDIRSIGILGDPSPYGMLMRKIAEEEAANYGLKVAASESYQQEDADFSVQIGRINAAGAGAIIMIGQGNAMVTVANNIKNLGLTKMLLLGSIQERPLSIAAGNILGSQFLLPALMIQIAEDDLSLIVDPKARAAAEAFVKPYKAAYKDADPGMASRAWDSVMMIVAAIEKAKSTDGTAMRDAFETFGRYVGAGANYDFTTDNHVGITENPYVMAYVKDGKLAVK
jgi:branched-chain amino acid transport system substrate-binding protein